MISQANKRLFFISIATVCFFILFRIYIINISSVQSDVPNSDNHIKTLAYIKYRERRLKIQDQCKKGNVNLLKVNADPKWKTTLSFDYENNTVMVAPAAGFYSTPSVGLNQIRIAYVLNEDSLRLAVNILAEALKVYKD